MIGLRIHGPRFDPLGIKLGSLFEISGKKHFLQAGLINLVEYELKLRENQLDTEVNSEGSRNQNRDSFDIICTLCPAMPVIRSFTSGLLKFINYFVLFPP